MTRRLAVLLGMLGAVLAAALALEPWATPPPNDGAARGGTSDASAPAKTAGQPTRAPVGSPPDASNAPVAALVATVVGRPLFEPSRRPPPGSEDGAPAGDRADHIGRLTGIAIGPAGAAAVFAGVGKAKPVALKPGERVGEWTVKTIEPRRVVLVGPTGEQVVEPTPSDAKPPNRPSGGSGFAAPNPRQPAPGAPPQPNPPRPGPPQAAAPQAAPPPGAAAYRGLPPQVPPPPQATREN